MNSERAPLSLPLNKFRNSGEQVKVLLVDDLKQNLLALEGLLRRDDIQLFKARSGTEALEYMISHEFALALIDVQMPVMSGFELAELMRGAKKTKNIPIIFVTASSEERNFSFRGYETGAVDFLPKPLDMHAVKSKVNIFIELFCQKRELKTQLEIITRNQKEQEELLDRLRLTQAELQQAVLIRDEFMSIASHELKTPLTSLSLNSQLRQRDLLKGDLKAFTAERLRRMFDSDEKQFDRIQHLIDNMLDISRINSGKLSMNFNTLDLCVLVRDVLERMAAQFVVADCKILLTTCPSAIGRWDCFRVEQVITNLLTNAVRYGAGKPIAITIETFPNKIRITVRDEGRGIAPENHLRIFQRFERAVLGSEITGLGLGLYIVRQILDSHGGSIRLQSALGSGSTFTVELPTGQLK